MVWGGGVSVLTVFYVAYLLGLGLCTSSADNID